MAKCASKRGHVFSLRHRLTYTSAASILGPSDLVYAQHMGHLQEVNTHGLRHDIRSAKTKRGGGCPDEELGFKEKVLQQQCLHRR
jgi:hypothetical protein